MEKKASSNKYYETILDWFKSQIMSGELKEGDTIFGAGACDPVWGQQSAGA